MTASYIESARQVFEQYKTLGEKSLERLSEEQLHWQFNEESNSVAVIVKHLSGNMLSRWTDFLTSDGEKQWRQRDAEFEEDAAAYTEVMHRWNVGWNCLFEALDSLTDQDLQRVVTIRAEEHTVTDAINRQLVHYAYHIGQIVYIARMCLGSEWISLSVPKGGSEEYNQSMMKRAEK